MSPCSPGTRGLGRLQRSSASPPTSHQLEARQMEVSSAGVQSQASNLKRLQMSNLSPSIPIDSSASSDLQQDLIPTFNIIPSTPVPSVSNIAPSEENAIEKSIDDTENHDKQGHDPIRSKDNSKASAGAKE